jgi:hypothetical protein
MRIRFSYWALIGLGFLCGCSADEGSPPDPYASREGFCGEWAKAACTAQVVSACAATSEDACIATQGAFCTEVVPAMAYRRSLGRACVSSVRAAYADGKLTADEAQTVLAGAAPCDFFCLEIGGECVEPILVGGGMECMDPASLCEENFYCDGTNCLAKRSEGRDCSEAVPCAAGLQCVGEPGAALCQAKAGPGEACMIADDCVSGICTMPAGETTGICAAEIILSAADPTCRNLR